MGPASPRRRPGWRSIGHHTLGPDTDANPTDARAIALAGSMNGGRRPTRFRRQSRWKIARREGQEGTPVLALAGFYGPPDHLRTLSWKSCRPVFRFGSPRGRSNRPQTAPRHPHRAGFQRPVIEAIITASGKARARRQGNSKRESPARKLLDHSSWRCNIAVPSSFCRFLAQRTRHLHIELAAPVIVPEREWIVLETFAAHRPM